MLGSISEGTVQPMQAWKTDLKMNMIKMMNGVHVFAGFNHTSLQEATTASNLQINIQFTWHIKSSFSD